MAFKAKFPGKCSLCGLSFAKGAEISWTRIGDKKVGHAACFAARHGNDVPVPNDNDEQPIIDVPVVDAGPNDLAALIAKAVAPLVTITRENIEDIVLDIVSKLDLAGAPKQIEIKQPSGTIVNMGLQHKQFPILLKMISAKSGAHRLNIWLAGPAGTGKTTAAEKCAEALGLDFAVTGSLTESYKLYGFMAPGNGQYVSTPFRKIWEHGGVFIFDDFDGSDPNCALEFNSALANGTCAFPDGMVKRHADCVLILTANTWGHGATDDYVGRLKQDKAFLNRFVLLPWEIDEDLEMATCADSKWCARVQAIRAKVKSLGIKVLVTPRASYYGAALIESGIDRKEVEVYTMGAAMTPAQWSSVC